MLTLVVEDDAISAFALTEELELAGQVVVGPARSSGEAIALVRARRPKVALIDLHLETDGAGLRLAQKLTLEFEMPVIFMTGHADLARAHADHALGLLTKPFEAAEVAEVVRYAEARMRGEHPPVPASFEPFR